jgi:hypothetical protein
VKRREGEASEEGRREKREEKREERRERFGAKMIEK